MSLISYAISWLMNLAWIALLIAIFDEILKTKIEENQGIAAFLIFIIPTLMEAISFYFTHKPFMYGI